MRQAFIILFLFMSLPGLSQSKYEKYIDQENGSLVLKGTLSFDDLNSDPGLSWFKQGVESYTPNTSSIEFLSERLPKYTIVTLMGTWCEDSHRLVPMLYKTLVAAGFPLSQHTMIGVNREKQAANGEHLTYSLEMVPTIIVFDGATEIGRIVEVTKESIEKDLMQIIEIHVSNSK